MEDGGIHFLCLLASKDIEAGNELLYDYGNERRWVDLHLWRLQNHNKFSGENQHIPKSFDATDELTYAGEVSQSKRA